MFCAHLFVTFLLSIFFFPPSLQLKKDEDFLFSVLIVIFYILDILRVCPLINFVWINDLSVIIRVVIEKKILYKNYYRLFLQIIRCLYFNIKTSHQLSFTSEKSIWHSRNTLFILYVHFLEFVIIFTGFLSEI